MSLRIEAMQINTRVRQSGLANELGQKVKHRQIPFVVNGVGKQKFMEVFGDNVKWFTPGGSVVRNMPTDEGDAGLIPGLERSPGEGNGSPLQNSCLGDPLYRGSWWAAESETTEQVSRHALPT